VTVLVDIQVVQLLCSRLCHDMVGPSGAVHNGMELYNEMDTADGADALKMVSSSVEQLSSRLAFFRMAFGLGGLTGRKPPLAESRDIIEAFLADGRVSIDWPFDEGAELAQYVSVPALKLLFNMVLVAIDALPRGGTLAVILARVNDDQDVPVIGMAVKASGDGARLKDELLSALSTKGDKGDATELNAHNVHGFFCQRLAEEQLSKLEVVSAENEVQFAVLVPERNDR